MKNSMKRKNDLEALFNEADPNYIKVQQKLDKIVRVLETKGYWLVFTNYDWFTQKEFRLYFFEGITESSFPCLPEILHTKHLANGGLLLKSSLTSKLSITQIVNKVLAWAKSLPKTVTCSFEINIPKSKSTEAFIDNVSRVTGVYRLTFVDDGDYLDSIIGTAIVARAKSKEFQQELTLFAKNHKTKVYSFID